MADIRIKDLATTATTSASDDYLALDGSTNGTRKILATNVANNVTDVVFGASGPSAKSSIAARAARQGLVFDGTSVASVANSVAFGTSDFSVSAIINPKSGIGSQQTIFNSLSVGGFYMAVKTDGTLGIAIAGSGFTVSSTGSVAFDKFSQIVYTRSGTTGTFYINGVAAGTATDSNNYTQPSNSLSFATFAQFFGTIAAPLFYNRALFAAEVVSLYEAGVPAGADYNNASNTSVITGDGWWSPYAGSSIASGTITLPNNSLMYNASALVVGKRYRVSLNVSALTGPVFVGDGLTYEAYATTGAKTYEWTATQTQFQIVAPDGSTATVTGVSLFPLGLLLAPDAGQAGNGYVWNDVSGNIAQIALPSSGVTWNMPSIATNRIRGTTNTNGNQQLLGASVLLPAESQILYVRARSRSGTPNVTIGTASGGAQIVASVALSTTWKNLTIALTGGIVSAADDIWIGSNSTDFVETDISWQPLDF